MLGKALPIVKVVRIAKRGFAIYGCTTPNTEKYPYEPLSRSVNRLDRLNLAASNLRVGTGYTVVVVLAPLGYLRQSRPIAIVEDKV